MSETMTKWKWFDVMQYEEEAEFLHEMHLQGWELAGVSLIGKYTFRKCQPEDVVYQLDYNKDEAEKHPNEYIQLFKDCGWEFICEFNKYQYFRKSKSEMEGTEDGIFCDEESRMDMLGRVFKGRIIPMIVCLFCLIVNSVNMHHGGLFFMPFWVLFWLCIILYMIVFTRFGLHYYRLRKRMKV